MSYLPHYSAQEETPQKKHQIYLFIQFLPSTCPGLTLSLPGRLETILRALPQTYNGSQMANKPTGTARTVSPGSECSAPAARPPVLAHWSEH